MNLAAPVFGCMTSFHAFSPMAAEHEHAPVTVFTTLLHRLCVDEAGLYRHQSTHKMQRLGMTGEEDE